MLNATDLNALSKIHEFLDEIAYTYVNHRLVPNHECGFFFPPFPAAQKIYHNLSPANRFVFSIFRQGHAAEERFARQYLPRKVFDAFVTTGLLAKNPQGHWQTPELSIVPVYGLYLVVSLPPNYPTARNKKQPIYLGPDSLWLTQAIPARLNGLQVVDVCAGSGIQGLVCATRGARRVVALERSESAATIAHFNAAFNGLDGIVEVRQSNLYSALKADERFDFFVCNPPFMPVMEDVDFPICGTGGSDGMTLLEKIFGELPEHLAEGASGVLFCHALGGQHHIRFNQEFLSKLATSRGIQFRAHVTGCAPLKTYVDNSLRPNIINTCPELSPQDREAKIDRWYSEMTAQGPQNDFLYDQIIWVRKNSPGQMENILAFNQNLSDSLYRQVAESTV